MAQSSSQYQSDYRLWLEHCRRKFTGKRIEWPQLFRLMIEHELARVYQEGRPYTGREVFLPRDKEALKYGDHKNPGDEEILCYRLYRIVHQCHEGAIKIGTNTIWLITCQAPNQGNHKGRRADLLGLRSDGSLIVFEAKGPAGEDTPLAALLEGLDYLSHLRIPENMEKLQDGFARWRATHGQLGVNSQTPQGFSEVQIRPKARHSVIVLAPEAYYARHRKDSKKISQDWEYLSDRFCPKSPISIGLDLAITDFSSPDFNLLPL